MSYYPPQPQPPYYPAPPPVAQTNSLAIVSLIAGILAWTLCPGLGAPIAIICGHIAKGQIRDSMGRMTGDGLATAGLVLGYIEIALALIGICVYLIFVVGIFGLAGISSANGY